jgi:predicted PurR-regulated permease PerM
MTSTTRYLVLVWLGLVALLCVLVWRLAPVLSPFIVAAALAYALQPTVDRLAPPRGRWSRPLVAGLVEMLALTLLLGVLLLILPILAREIPLLRAQIPPQVQRLSELLQPWLLQFGIPFSLDAASVQAFVMKHANANLEDWLAAALSSVRIGGSFVLTVVGHLVLVPIVTYYLLLDWPNLRPHLTRLVPPRLVATMGGFVAECDSVLGQYLRGQLSVMLILAVYYSTALALAGFELALPVGVFTGLAVCVPYLGFGFGALLALLAGVLQYASFYGVWVVVVVYGLGQFAEGFFLTPRLVGERIGLHPVTVIFVLLAFGQLLGFVGVLIALPAGAVGLVLWRRLLVSYFASRFYQG